MKITDNQILNGISKLKRKLENLQIDTLNIGNYNRQYLKVHLSQLEYSFYLNGCVLQKIVDQKDAAPESVCDYGGGTGLLGFLAKESFGCRLLYVDIYEEACHDVLQISGALGIEIDQIVHGAVKSLVLSKIKAPEFVISRDVIEHIYDLKMFFADCHQWDPQISHVHNTSANIYNVFRKRYFNKVHHINEYLGAKGLELKDSETERPYFEIRKEIILKESPDIDEKELNDLAKLTRGMMVPDIISSITKFRTGQLTKTIERHPTNTCDPYTGNWAERLLKIEQYQDMAKPFYLASISGTKYNNAAKGTLKKVIVWFLNLTILNIGTIGRFIWPTITISFNPHQNQNS